MVSVSDWLNGQLTELKHDIFKDAIRVSVAETKPVDSQIVYISQIERITLLIETSTGERHPLRAVAKSEPPPGPGWDMAVLLNAFSTEITMYTEVLNAMKNLIKESIKNDTLWPDCYHCGNNKLLIQDLNDLDYKIVPTYKFLDVEHMLLVMKSIGKFHGLSLVLKERYLLQYKDLGMPYYSRRIPSLESLQLKSLNDLIKVIREDWDSEWCSVPERLLRFFGKPGDALHSAWKSSKGRWDVLNHGDFTLRNMLFRYPPDSSQPDSMKLVDFQMSHFSNLGNDLVTVLYSSVEPQIREKNMKIFLETYVDSLALTANAHDYGGTLPSVTNVEECIRSLHPLAFLTILFSIPAFVVSGKRDLQKYTKECIEKHFTLDDLSNTQCREDNTNYLDFLRDQQVSAYLKFDLKRFMEMNVF